MVKDAIRRKSLIAREIERIRTTEDNIAISQQFGRVVLN